MPPMSQRKRWESASFAGVCVCPSTPLTWHCGSCPLVGRGKAAQKPGLWVAVDAWGPEWDSKPKGQG